MQATLDPPVAAPTSVEAARPSLFSRVLRDRGALLDEIVAGRKPNMLKVVLGALALTALGGLALGVASPHPLQIPMAALKTPIVVLGALVVSFPAFYIFSVLLGSRVSVGKLLRLFAVALGLRGAIVAGLAPLVLFFASVGSPYGFLLLSGLVCFGLAEIGFLHTIQAGVKRLRASGDPINLALTRAWMVIYVAVGMQLTWSLRPIIGLCHHEANICHWTLIGGGPGGNMFTHFLSNVAKLVM